MKVSLNWLREYLPDLSNDLSVLTQVFQRIGVEVENVEKRGEGIHGAVLARVTSIKALPPWKKLFVCKLDAGKEKPTVVCGAPNLPSEPGDNFWVPWLPPGAKTSAGQVIEKKEFGKIFSEGMIASRQDLGLEAKSDGIWILLPPFSLSDMVLDPQAGKKLSGYFPEDLILDLEITPNRGDLLSHIGVARELSWALEIPLTDSRVAKIPIQGPKSGKMPEIHLEDALNCQRYTAVVLDDLNIGPSPSWLQERLLSIGSRPISNVVDITNFILFDRGQPLHAFDLDLMGGKEIKIRQSVAGEKIETIDGVERELPEGILLIAGKEKPLAVAGVMGGASSAMNEGSQRVLLESAFFHPSAVRKSSRLLSLDSDSSYRFARGININAVLENSRIATALFIKVCGARLASSWKDCFPQNLSPEKIPFSIKDPEKFLGISMDEDEIWKALEGIGCQLEKVSLGEFQVIPPAYRSDLERTIDLVEEVARVYGYEKIPAILPPLTSNPLPLPKAWEDEEGTRDFLVYRGFFEVLTGSFQGEKQMRRWFPGEITPPRLMNPIREEEPFLRPALISSLLEVYRLNASRLTGGRRFFELAHCFSKEDSEERILTALAVVGRKIRPDWTCDEIPSDLFELKGVVEGLLESLYLHGFEFKNKVLPFLHPHRSSVIFLRDEGREIGWFGELHPEKVKEELGETPNHYYCFSLFMDQLRASSFSFHPLRTHPPSDRDLALVLPLETSCGEVEGFLRATAVKEEYSVILESIHLVDRFCGEQVGEGKQSLSFRMRFRSKDGDRTLKDEEVKEVFEAMISNAEKELGAALRPN